MLTAMLGEQQKLLWKCYTGESNLSKRFASFFAGLSEVSRDSCLLKIHLNFYLKVFKDGVIN